MKHILLLLFSISVWANFFVVDRGKVIEIVNEPNKNIHIVGSNGKALRKYKKLSHIKRRKKKVHKCKKRYYRKKVHKRLKNRDLIVIRSSKRILEYYRNGKWFKNYKVAVGKAGWEVYGKFWVRKKVKWPDWIPTKKIKKENPRLPDIIPGGPKNPLGARALYLGYSKVRIHGTTNPHSIGKAVSHGCFRMRNKDVIELYNMVKIGTPVYVK